MDGIEVDIRLSKDDIPFLYHDDTLEETTNGQGLPEDHTWKQLQELCYLDAGGSKIASLEEVLKLVGSQKYLFLDVKTNKIFNKKLVQKIAGLIHHYHLQKSVIVGSFNPFFLISMRLAARDILLMYDFTTDSIAIGEETQSQFDQIPWILKQPFFQKQVRRIVRPDLLGIRWNVDEKLLKSLINHGYPIICWTIDNAKIADKLFELGIKGIQTNKPLELMTSPRLTSQIVYDAGGSVSEIGKVIHVKNDGDVVRAVREAEKNKKKITIAGQRHSMGGQTLLDYSIQLNMMGIDHVHYNSKTHTVKVGAGATWKKIQHILDQHGRSIQVMQSDNIFTVGGSISVNVHGWQVGKPPISSTILSMKIITADGLIHEITKDKEADLFKLVIGGYGQFGVILEAELITVANSTVKFHAQFMKPQYFAEQFQKRITKNPNVELAYGRLSLDKDKLFEEIGLFWYEKVDTHSPNQIKPESLIAFKRAIFRSSQYLKFGRKMRWFAEKTQAKILENSAPVSRNNAMNTDIHVLWPLYGQRKDILHEYFVPKNKLCNFLDHLKTLIQRYNMNILNITIRDVQQDHLSFLSYAHQDMFGLVLFFSQGQDPKEEEKMSKFTRELINKAISLNGTFYLPYRLCYNKEQILGSYPNILQWIELKEKWDPKHIFDSQFFKYIKNLF